ncbi:hypothetical protein BKA61DRAFT_359194 [Leptodontidium sp. MPI-SDFR-AT-0119]|nr:hypothetical protein BKA61DRAFT_359194 [Leptodontidium sp. MPI-SDFR-AT-0119]
MSGSPPLPPRRDPGTSDRGHGSYGSSRQDVSGGIQTPLLEHSDQGPPMAYPGPYSLANMPPTTQNQYLQQLPQLPSPQQQQKQHHGYVPHPQQLPVPYPRPDSPPIREPPEFSLPKQQRKTKGHIASACVPCKRAHLRCDAQRPCSRCLSNGKADACIDVQHKKRGLLRLRDERESRYKVIGSGYPPPADPSLRRPVSLYACSDSSQFSQDPLQRSRSYRVLKSQGGPLGGGSMGPRFLEHASSADANIYGAPMPLTPRTLPSHEPPCAYLTMEMQFSKTTQSFGETIGVQSIQSRRLQDVISLNDRQKVARLQRIFEDERRDREPNYLPPIYLAKFEEDHVIQTIGFGQEEIGMVRTDRQEMFTFQAPDGQQSTFQVQLGLAKRDSTYFIILLLVLPATPQTFHQPASSPYPRESYSRDSQYGYRTLQQGYQQTPGASPFRPNPGFKDPRGDMTAYRTPSPLSPGIPPSASITGFAQPQRPDYAQGPGPYQTPRSELRHAQAQVQSQRPHDLQLPPIRDQRGEVSSSDPMRRPDSGSGRVNISSLLEKPDYLPPLQPQPQSRRHHDLQLPPINRKTAEAPFSAEDDAIVLCKEEAPSPVGSLLHDSDTQSLSTTQFRTKHFVESTAIYPQENSRSPGTYSSYSDGETDWGSDGMTPSPQKVDICNFSESGKLSYSGEKKNPLDPILSPIKQSLVEGMMKEFWAIFNQENQVTRCRTNTVVDESDFYSASPPRDGDSQQVPGTSTSPAGLWTPSRQ